MNTSLINFHSTSEFYILKKQLFDEIMEIASKLALYATEKEVTHDLIQNDGTCSSSGHIASDLYAALIRYTKNNVKLANELTSHFLLSVDTCLLAFFLVLPYHDQEHLDIQDIPLHADGDLRMTNTEMLMMLLRQVVLKMTRFDGFQFSAFSLSFQFTPVRFCNPIAIVNENNKPTDSELELIGPFGCPHVIERNHDLSEPFDDIITEVPTFHLQEMFLSFAMGSQIRLGNESPLLDVPSDVLALIKNLTVELF